MNQDFTEKKAIFVVQRVSPEKKIRAQVVNKKKNSCNMKIPLPAPIIFLMVRPLFGLMFLSAPYFI